MQRGTPIQGDRDTRALRHTYVHVGTPIFAFFSFGSNALVRRSCSAGLNAGTRWKKVILECACVGVPKLTLSVWGIFGGDDLFFEMPMDYD